ncbi:hypothetical signal peptide protein and DUF5881 domain-containing protein [Megavirus chiliensis]|nr:hypothetical protein MegaChil _gp0174 [Megavirus chiliensis]AEQ33398.1 hypothetical signal peptide protein and DUF5881 domain-containing protein [Megavirus chiliensis]AGD92075.1 hypothetical protein LBA_00155 [Megavirus lba]
MTRLKFSNKHMNLFNAFTVLLVLCAAMQSVTAMAPGLKCPPPKAYPEDLLDNLWSGPQAYQGTTRVRGSVQIDTTGEFDFVKVANITGTFLQSYCKEIGSYFSEYYIDIEGVPVLVLNITFTLLEDDKLSQYNSYCTKYTPGSTEYIEATPVNNKFFYTTYHNTDIIRGPQPKFNFGDITQSEFFFLDSTRKKTINLVSAFNPDATLKTFTTFNFEKVSNQLIPPTTSSGVQKRTVNDYSETVKIGKLDIPIQVIQEEYRHLFR